MFTNVVNSDTYNLVLQYEHELKAVEIEIKRQQQIKNDLIIKINRLKFPSSVNRISLRSDK